jgi:hypothetical protein
MALLFRYYSLSLLQNHTVCVVFATSAEEKGSLIDFQANCMAAIEILLVDDDALLNIICVAKS